MKNKKVTYFLLVLSISLWGFIGWKVYKAFSYASPEIPTVKKETRIEKKDSVSLLLNYRDPFLGKYSPQPSPKDTSSIKRQVTAVSPPSKATESVSPAVQYKGRMNIGKTSMAILQHNGKVLTIQTGEEVDGYKLTRIEDDKITLHKDRKKYEISIQ